MNKQLDLGNGSKYQLAVFREVKDRNGYPYARFKGCLYQFYLEIPGFAHWVLKPSFRSIMRAAFFAVS